MRRVVLVVTDGLRPDAVSTSLMPSLDALGRRYTRAEDARTIRPSATVAALASLATGVSPRTHGLVEPGLSFLARLAGLRPVARELSRAGLSTTIVAGELAPAARPVTRALAAAAGARTLNAGGGRAREIASRACDALAQPGDGFYLVYLPDCDRAGHRDGWMSQPYLDAARELDAALGLLTECTAHALLMVVSDHGGGGVTPRDHDAPHHLNDRIPLVLAGPRVRQRHVIRRRTSILDIPATLLWALGLDVPPTYEGRILREAFAPVRPAEATVGAT